MARSDDLVGTGHCCVWEHDAVGDWDDERQQQLEEQRALYRLSEYAVAITADRIPDWLLDTLLGVRSS